MVLDTHYFAHINTNESQASIGNPRGMNAAELVAAITAHRESEWTGERKTIFRFVPIRVEDENGNILLDEDHGLRS
jgi:hypothetical protein